MKPHEIIRAWKDEEFLARLSEEQRNLLPENPAGIVELPDEALRNMAAGERSILGWCPDFQSDFIDPWDFCSDGWNPCGGGGGGGIDHQKYYCFEAGTLVRVPGGERPIHTLTRGDRILTFDAGAGRVREARVENLEVHDVVYPVFSLQSGEERLRVTAGHRFFGEDGWSPVEALTSGQRCLDLRERARPVQVEGGRPARSRVYNVRVEGYDSYFVGSTGLLVRDH